MNFDVHDLLDPHSKIFWFAIVGILIAVGIILIVSILMYNGLLFPNDNFIVTIDSPTTSDTIYEHTYFTLSGRIFGGPASKVYVWDAAYNVGRLAGLYSSQYAIELNSDAFSTGSHTLCVQAIGDGKVSNVAQIEINIVHPRYSSYTRTGYITDNFPSPFGFLLRPIETAVRDVVVTVSGGTAPDDLNGDNIPDSMEMSPIAPTYNPTNIPLTFLFIVIGLFVLVVVVAFYLKEILMRRMKSETEYRQYLLKHPSAWKTVQRNELSKLKLQLQIAKANNETNEMKKLEKKINAIQKRTKNPVKIYIDKKGGK